MAGVKARRKRVREAFRSSTGKKHYRKRRADGTFEDIQSYQRAHRADLRRKSKAGKEKARARA